MWVFSTHNSLRERHGKSHETIVVEDSKNKSGEKAPTYFLRKIVQDCRESGSDENEWVADSDGTIPESIVR